MIKVKDFETEQLVITNANCDRTITLNVPEFLNGASNRQFKKLLKEIRQSTDPECMKVMENYISKWMQEYEPEQKTHANLCVQYRTKARVYRDQLEDTRKTRDRYKRKSTVWETYNDKSEMLKTRLRNVLAADREHDAEFKANKRMKEKFEKWMISI